MSLPHSRPDEPVATPLLRIFGQKEDTTTRCLPCPAPIRNASKPPCNPHALLWGQDFDLIGGPGLAFGRGRAPHLLEPTPRPRNCVTGVTVERFVAWWVAVDGPIASGGIGAIY